MHLNIGCSENQKLILVPTQRLAYELRAQKIQALERGEKSAFQMPLILSFQRWVDQLWRFACLSLPQLPRRLTSWQTSFFWKQLIAESTPGLMNVPATAQLALEAWARMKQWRLPCQRGPGLSQDVIHFLDWAERWMILCEQHGWIDEAQLVEQVIAVLPNIRGRLPDHIHCQGFDDWPPGDRALLKTLEGLGVKITHEPSKISASAFVLGGVKAFVYPDTSSEWQAAALWAKQFQHRSDLQIAIVIPSLATDRAQIEAVFREMMDPWGDFRLGEKIPKTFNLSGGIPLSQVPILEQALSYLKKQPSVLGVKHQDWVSWVVQQLSLCNWPGERIVNSDDFQAIEHFHTVLKQIQVDLLLIPACTQEQFMGYLQEICQNELFQTQSRHEQPNIHVLGILEAAGLSFDHLWIADLVDGSWPGPVMPNPFIDLQLQKVCQMPHASADRELDFCRKILQRLVSGVGKQVIFSVPAYREGRMVMPSQLLYDYVSDLDKAPLDLIKSELAREIQFDPRDYEYKDDPQGLPFDRAENKNFLKGGTALFKAQASCSYKAYAEYRLGLEPPIQESQGLSPLDRGQWMHKVLELFWGDLKSQKALKKASDQDLEKHLQSIVMAAFPRGDLRGSHRKLIELEFERMKAVLWRYIAFERDFQRIPFEVRAIESKHLLNIEGLLLKVRLDRLDSILELEEEGDWIIDYKTGPFTLKNWMPKGLLEPQLPLYLLYAALEKIKGIAVIEIHARRILLHTLTQENCLEKTGLSWEKLKVEWQEKIEQLTRDFLKGMAKVQPLTHHICKRCHLESFCRKFEGLEGDRR